MVTTERKSKSKTKVKAKKTKTPAKKTAVKKKPVKTEPKPEPKQEGPKERYIEAVGRRRTAIARVRIFSKKEGFEVNNKKLVEYFPSKELQNTALAPLEILNLAGKFLVTVKTRGGGLQGQAEALRHGLARTLIKFNPEFRKRLKKAGYLRRDPRMKERKKYGLKKARRAPQWKKR